MSRVGKKKVPVPKDVKVEFKGTQLWVSKGPESLSIPIHETVVVAYDAGASEICVTRKGDERLQRAMHGTTRALIANMVLGVTRGFTREMKVFGTGYGVKQEGSKLVLTIGMAKPANMVIPPGIKVEIKTPQTRGNEVPAEFTIRGADKATVGRFASECRKVRPPEPYQGKGIRYANEVVKRKVGKAFSSGG